MLHGTVSNATRYLELSREAANGQRWGRATDLCHMAREQLARAVVQPVLDATARTELEDVLAALLGYMATLRARPREGQGALPVDVYQGLNNALLMLHTADARITAVRSE